VISNSFSSKYGEFGTFFFQTNLLHASVLTQPLTPPFFFSFFFPVVKWQKIAAKRKRNAG
jgi:hypothetical protein